MYILDECTEAAELCKNIEPFLNVVRIFLDIVCWSIPIILIIMGSIDMFKAVTKADDEKILQDARRKLVMRIIYGVAVFLVPFIINLIFEVLDGILPKDDIVNGTTWISCWNGTIEGMDSCSDIYAPEKEQTTVNTCNCRLCESDNSNCQYAELPRSQCKAEGGTCSEQTGNLCYVWEEYTCSVNGTKYGSDVDGCAIDYSLTDEILKGWYQNVGDIWDYFIREIDNGGVLTKAEEYCKEKLKKEPKEVYFTNKARPNEYEFSIEEKGNIYFTCVYDKQIEKNAKTSKPEFSITGKYKEYTCSKQECNSTAEVLCSFVGEKNTETQ